MVIKKNKIKNKENNASQSKQSSKSNFVKEKVTLQRDLKNQIDNSEEFSSINDAEVNELSASNEKHKEYSIPKKANKPLDKLSQNSDRIVYRPRYVRTAWEIENEVDYGDSYSEDEDVTNDQVQEPEDVYTSDKTYTDDDLSDERIENLLGWDNLRKSLLHISCFKEAFDSMRLQGLSIEENYLCAEVPKWGLPLYTDSKSVVLKKLRIHRRLRLLQESGENSFNNVIQDMHKSKTMEIDDVSLDITCKLNSLRVVDYNEDRFNKEIVKSNYLIDLGKYNLVDPVVDTPRVNNNEGDSHSFSFEKQMDNNYNEVESNEDKGVMNKLEPGVGLNLSGKKRSRSPQMNNNSNTSHTTEVQVINNFDISDKIILGKFDSNQIVKVLKFLEQEVRMGRKPNLYQHFSPESRTLLTTVLVQHKFIEVNDIYSQNWFSQWDIEKFLRVFKEIYVHKKQGLQLDIVVHYKNEIEKASKLWVLEVDQYHKLESTLLNPIIQMFVDIGDPDEIKFQQIFKFFIDKIKKNSGSSAEYIATQLKDWISKIENPRMAHLITAIEVFLKDVQDVRSNLVKMGSKIVNDNNQQRFNSYSTSDVHSSKPGMNKSNTSKNKEKGKRPFKESSNSSSVILSTRCRGCGSNRHKSEACPDYMRTHPDYNKSKVEWVDSTQFKTLSAKFPGDESRHFLRRYYDIKGNKLASEQQIDNKKGKNLLLSNVNTKSCIISNDTYLISSKLMTGSHHLGTDALIDSGAIHANYCSEKVAAWIKKSQKQDPGTHTCMLDAFKSNEISTSILANTNISITSNSVVSCNFLFCNELNKNFEVLPCLNFKVIKTNFDVIIGLPTIRKYSLAQKLPSVFGGSNVVESRRGINHAASLEVLPESKSCDSQICSSCDTICYDCANTGIGTIVTNTSFSSSKEQEKYYTFSSNKMILNNDNYEKSGALRSSFKQLSAVQKVDVCCSIGCNTTEQAISRDKPSTIHRRELLGDPIKDDEILDKEHPIDNLNREELSSDELLDLITIEGSPSLKVALRLLCEEYRHIFSTTVRSEPAKVPEMKFDIDMDKWRHKRNGLPSQIHSSEKQKDILRKVIKILLDLYIIEISTASEYSHVHLVPKPVVLVECRLTIDFVKLNECTIVMKGWLITIISLVLCQKLGVKRHTFFELIMKRIRKLN